MWSGPLKISLSRSQWQRPCNAWRKGGGGEDCASVRAKLSWSAIYCNNPRLNPESQSGSRSWKGLGRRALHTMGEYNSANAILIRLLDQPHTCEIGSSIYSTMSWVKVASTIVHKLLASSLSWIWSYIYFKSSDAEYLKPSDFNKKITLGIGYSLHFNTLFKSIK